MNNGNTGKDLTKEAPRSPKTKLGGFVILARTIDKCRALLDDIRRVANAVGKGLDLAPVTVTAGEAVHAA